MNQQETTPDKIETSENLNFGSVTSNLKEAAAKLIESNMSGSDYQEFLKYSQSHPELSFACYNGGEVIGVVYGAPKDEEEVVLWGIAIDYDRAGKGAGSKLIKYFESAVQKLGFRKISLGSAEGYVEHFYLKNGYKPIEYYVEVNEGSSPDLSGFEIVRERREGGKLIFNIRVVDGYNLETKESIRQKLKASKVIYIFEKDLTPPNEKTTS